MPYRGTNVLGPGRSQAHTSEGLILGPPWAHRAPDLTLICRVQEGILMYREPSRVLLVNAGESDDQALVDLLEGAGHAVRAEAAADRALEAIDVWQPAAVVIDVRSAHRAERYVREALAARLAATWIPVVLVGEAANLLKPSRLLPFALVATPLDADGLLVAVQRALNSRELVAL